MKHAFAIFAIVTLTLFTQGCRQQDFRTVEIKVPTVINAACETRVRQAIRPLKGIDMDSVKFENGSVVVRYDSMMLGIKNIEHAIKDAGFDANEFPADPEAKKKLPSECLNPMAK